MTGNGQGMVGKLGLGGIVSVLCRRWCVVVMAFMIYLMTNMFYRYIIVSGFFNLSPEVSCLGAVRAELSPFLYLGRYFDGIICSIQSHPTLFAA